MKAIFAYVPVVHAQALSLFESHKDHHILLLDNEVGKLENVYLERDARALKASDIATELHAHGFDSVEVVKPEELDTVLRQYSAVLVPEDEILDYFLTKYAPGVSIERVNIFIRWTQKLSSTEFIIPEDRVVTQGDRENQLMVALEAEAQKSPDWWRQIGAAIVKEGKVVAQAHNAHFPNQHALTVNGDPRSNFDAGQGAGIYTSIHAEANAIALAAKAGIATNGADIFVTTFPCPTCARSLVVAGIKKVFYKKGYSLLDAETILKDAGIEIILVKENE
jgi:dCMP deaminase